MKMSMGLQMTLITKSAERVLVRLSALGLIVSVMIAPSLGLASVLSDLAATVQPGEFVELEIDGPVSTCQAMIPPLPLKDEDGNDIPPRNYLGNILEFTDEALLYPPKKEIYIMGTRRPYKRWDQGFVKYSEATNSWTILDLPPFGVGAHGYDNGAIDVSRGHYYWSRVADARDVWSMDLETNEWRQLPNAPINAAEFSSIDFFPNIDKLVFFDARAGKDSEYALYNPDSDQWTSPVSLTEPFGEISHFSEYSPNHGVMFFGGGHNYSAGGTIPDPTPNIDESRRLYMLDDEQVVTRLADAPTAIGQSVSGPIQTTDPSTGNLVVFQGRPNDGSSPCPDPLPIWEHNLATNTWAQTGMQSLSDYWCRMNTVAVPLPEYGVHFIVSVKSETNCQVQLYRHSSETAPLNISVQPVAVTVTQGQLAGFSIVVVGNGPYSYQWRKNGVNIEGATEASYSFIASDIADNNSVFDVVVNNAAETVVSAGATLTIIEDVIAPTLVSAFATGSNKVDLIFSEAISTASAENITNYKIDPGITVSAASLGDDSRTVALTVGSLIEDTSYTVSVSDVQDLAENPNTILTGSSKSFTYRTADSFEDGNADGWLELTTSRWDVEMDEGDMAYCINTTDVTPVEGSRLGEYSLLPSGYGDFTFTAQARLGDDVTNNSWADYALVFGFQDTGNYYFALFNNEQSATQLFKVVDGIRGAALATATTDWLNDNAYHSVKVSRLGNDISVYFDNALVMSASDSTFGIGKVGVGSYNDSACFDDVSVMGAASTSLDSVAPVITLLGENPQTLIVGEAYIELGASAIDNIDGDLGAIITVNASALNTNTVGTYRVTYNVSDTAGNAAAEVSRTVNVTAAPIVGETGGSSGGGALGGWLLALMAAFRVCRRLDVLTCRKSSLSKML